MTTGHLLPSKGSSRDPATLLAHPPPWKDLWSSLLHVGFGNFIWSWHKSLLLSVPEELGKQPSFSQRLRKQSNQDRRLSLSITFLRWLLLFRIKIRSCLFCLLPPPAEASVQPAASQRDFEQPPLTHAPGVLLKHDMSHHFTFVIGRHQGSQEKLGLIDPKVRSLGLLITSETPVELLRRAAQLAQGARPPTLPLCGLGCSRAWLPEACANWWHGRSKRALGQMTS